MDCSYISDIGGGDLKPFFILGCFATGLPFAVVLLRIHIIRLRHRQQHSLLDKTVRVLAMVSGLGAAAALCLLSILDTRHWRQVHIPLLYVFCAGMLLSATCTAAAERNGVMRSVKQQDGRSTQLGGRERKWKLAIITLIVVELGLVVIFVALFSNLFLFTVGILEWIVAFLFVPYLWAIGIYLPETEDADAKTVPETSASEKEPRGAR